MWLSPSQVERDRAELNWPEEKLYITGKSRLDAGSFNWGNRLLFKASAKVSIWGLYKTIIC